MTRAERLDGGPPHRPYFIFKRRAGDGENPARLMAVGKSEHGGAPHFWQRVVSRDVRDGAPLFRIGGGA
jgi:hypothetical protein